MLPSTGLFKATNCSFYDSGLCERPYCHFRHVKKEPSSSLEADEEVLEQLVSDAVQKVLQNSELPSSSLSEQLPHEDFVSKGVDDLLPVNEEKDCSQVKPPNLPTTVPSYKPTPIAELNKKRHIPVPYTPRSCSSVQPKRNISPEHIFEATKRQKLSAECPVTPSSEYNPEVDTNKCVGYSPSLPKNQTNGTNNHSYIPSAIANLISPLMDYIPTGNSDKNVSYEPSGKKIQEPEYRPNFDSGTILPPSNYTPTDKAVLEELNLDEFSTELKLLDEIINEHSESINEKNLEKLNEGSTDCFKGIKQPNDIRDRDLKDNFAPALDPVSKNNISVAGSLFLGDGKPNPSVEASKKEDHVTKDKEHKRHTKSSRHSSSKSRSSRSSKSSSSSSKDKKKEEESKHKSKSSRKTTNSKEHKSSSSSKRSTKSRSSSTSKDQRSGSHSKESKSSSSNKRNSKNTKRKNSPDKITASQSLSDDGAGNSDVDANSCGNEPLTDPDDDEIEEECFKIFQEYAPEAETVKKNPLPFQKLTETEESEPELPSRRLRIAHDGNAQALSKLVAPPRRKPVINPALTMMKRFEDLKESYQLKVTEKVARTTLVMQRVELGGLLTNHKCNTQNLPSKTLNQELLKANSSLVKTVQTPSTTTPSSTKLRIAHVPNVPNLLEEKSRVQRSKPGLHQRTQNQAAIRAIAMKQTVAQSAPKGGQRSAHVPNANQLKKPTICQEAGSKVPTVMRQQCLDMFIKEYQNVMSAEESYGKAAEAEESVFLKANNKTLYSSSVTVAIVRLRKEHGMSGPLNIPGAVRHSAMLGGKKGKEFSVIQPKKPVAMSVYQQLLRYKLTDAQLVEHGYPRHHPTIKGMAVSQSSYDKNLPWEGRDRTCCRCSKNYTVDSKGLQIEKDECLYHWGKIYRSNYRCCGGGLDSPACADAPCHVTTNFKLNNTGFVETIMMDIEPPDGDFGVYALDCEMIYTTKGLELARVTVVDRKLHTVYDTMVKPTNPILDYTTRFSGITEEHMEGVTTTIAGVQAAMLSFINSKTILIGHSLDSDLRALKLIHDTVVDTSIVFPHQRSTEFKNPLRKLTEKYLHRLIQENVEGHSSAEDAIAAMELILYRIKEDSKTG